MRTLARSISEAMPSNNALIVGIVASLAPLTVTVRGTNIRPGTLGSYIPSVGDVVVMFREEATWVVLGPSASGGIDATTTVAGFNSNSAAATTTSASYTNIGGALFVFTKRFQNSAVRFDFAVSAFITGATNTAPNFAVDFIDQATLINYRFDIFTMLINPLSTHTPMSAMAKLTGIPAGVFNVQAIWRRASGAGTLAINADDWLSMMATEVV